MRQNQGFRKMRQNCFKTAKPNTVMFIVSTCMVTMLTITGCSSVGGGRTQISGGQQALNTNDPARPYSEIEGSWFHSEGLFKTTFSNGRFESVSPQTGDRLAAGSYTSAGNKRLSMNWLSSRQTRENAVCEIVNEARLTCVPSNGSSFSMTRA